MLILLLLTSVCQRESNLLRSAQNKIHNSAKLKSLLTCQSTSLIRDITAAILTTLQTSITSFNNSIPKGRVAVTDSGEATQLLVGLFKTLSANWAKIDTLVEMVRTSQPNFYNEYIKVRKVIETGTGSLALKIKATNAQTGAPEANVTLTLTPVNEQLKAIAANGKSSIVKKTAAGGGSNYKNIADGTYSVMAKKPGFKDLVETVNVVNGEMTVLEIMLEKA